jgi:PAS domain S-box-containing protein
MAQTEDPTADTEPITKRRRVLLADGHNHMRRHLAQILSEQYEVDTAADAPTALRLALTRVPDVVVADVSIESMDEFDCLREFRSDSSEKIPIVLYSTGDKDSPADLAKVRSSDDLIMPFSERQLLSLVRAHAQVAQIREESIQSLRLSEERFRILKTTITPGVWVANSRGEMTSDLAWWWEKKTGQTPEQYRGFGWLNAVHPSDKDNVVERWQTAMRTRSAHHAEFRIKKRDGTYGYVRVQGAPVRDAHDNVRGWIGTLQDIDDQKKTQEALRLSEQRYQTLAASTSVGVWHANARCEVIGQCPGWQSMTGQTPEQYRGMGWMSVVHPEDKQQTLEILERALRHPHSFVTDYRARRRDGSYGYVRAQGAPVLNENGSVREWIGTFTDINDQKLADETLRTTEEEFRANFELAGIGQVHTHPKTGRYLRVNKKFCEMIGYSAEELQTMTYLDVTHPEERAAAMDDHLDLLRGGANFATERRYVRKDGATLWGRVTSTLIHDGHGHPLRTMTMIEDVTERRQWEALALCQKKALEMVAKGNPLVEILNFVVLSVEREATAELRASIQVLDEQGKHFVMCAAPSLPESYRQSVASFPVDFQDRDQGMTVFLREPVVVSDLENAPEWVELARALTPYAIRSIWSAPIISSDQKPRGTFCFYSSRPRAPSEAQQKIIENVTQTIALAIERKQAESEREKLLVCEQSAREQAEAANRVKDEFLAVVSHELRTPLNSINGWAYMLLNGTMDRAAQMHALKSIKRQVVSQGQLIDDLLDVSRIVAGKLRLELREIHPSWVIAAALDVVRPAAEAKQIALASELDPAVITMSADPERLQQVIWNLLSNAIKFTPNGGRVGIRSRGTDSTVEIVVADTGQGISEEFLPHVFERFQQADASTGRKHGGLGLGLAIARHLIELHGGTVHATSAGPGKGATFTVRLPLRVLPTDRPRRIAQRIPESRALANVITAEDRDILKGLRVLVVDDNSEDREVLFAELGHQGATVSTSDCAAGALCELDKFRPDVLVADIGLPSEDGYSLIRKIRTCSVDRGGHTPAIALTAYGGDANRKRALEAGYQKHMTKPADPNELARTIVSLAAGSVSKP